MPNGPGMQIFSPDGKYGYICSSFTPETVVVSVADHQIVGRVKQESPFCPNIAATPDGKQVWFTLKDIGKTQVFNARPPFNLIKTIETGPITNHVNFARTPTAHSPMSRSAAPTRSRCFVPTTSRKSRRSRSANCRTASGPPATARASMSGSKTPTACRDRHRHQQGDREHSGRTGAAGHHLCPGRGARSGRPAEFAAARRRRPGRPSHPGAKAEAKGEKPPTSVSLFDQGLIQILQASVTGLQPKKRYVLALATRTTEPDGAAAAAFMTNPAGSAIVNAVGPIRQIVQSRRGRTAISGHRARRARKVRRCRAGPDPMNDMLRLIEPVIPALRRYARALVRNRAAADDLVQDCLERAVSHWGQRREGDPRPWLFTILHNLALSQFRRSARRGSTSPSTRPMKMISGRTPCRSRN